MTYLGTKFEVARSHGLGGDTFTRNVTDGRTHAQTGGRTDGRRTDFGSNLIYPFFLKKKAGITRKRETVSYNKTIGAFFFRLTSGLVNPLKRCSPRRNRGEHHCSRVDKS